MHLTKIFLYVITSILLTTGCTSDKEQSNEPSRTDIAKKLNFKLPSFTKVKNITIEVSENIGSQVEPQYNSRFRGTLEFVEPLYKVHKRILNKSVLEELVKKGSEIKVFGVARSTLEMGEWKIKIKKFEMSDINGKPLSKWAIGEYVYKGSKEEKALEKEDEAQEKKLATEREISLKKAQESEKKEYTRQQKAKEERLKREQEEESLRQKLVADKQARKEAKEKIDAEKQAKKDKIIAIATRAVTGEWKGKFNCLEYGGLSTINIDISPLSSKLTGVLSYKGNNRKFGKMSMAGEINEHGKLSLISQGWIGEHNGYNRFGITGTLNATGSKIVGNINARKSMGCTVFEIHRVN